MIAAALRAIAGVDQLVLLVGVVVVNKDERVVAERLGFRGRAFGLRGEERIVMRRCDDRNQVGGVGGTSDKRSACEQRAEQGVSSFHFLPPICQKWHHFQRPRPLGASPQRHVGCQQRTLGTPLRLGKGAGPSSCEAFVPTLGHTLHRAHCLPEFAIAAVYHRHSCIAYVCCQDIKRR